MGIHPLNPHDASADDRRTFLKRLAIGGAAAAVATQVVPLDRLTPAGLGQDAGGEGGGEEGPELSPDEETIAFLAGLALATASAYRAAVGDEAPDPDPEAEVAPPSIAPVSVDVPEPVSEVLRSFGSHHNQQANALSGLLPAEVGAPNGSLAAELSSTLAGVDDVDGLLEALRAHEERLAATHLSVLADMTDEHDAAVVVRTLPVLAQHAVVLGRIGEEAVDPAELIPELQPEDDPLTPEAYPPGSVEPPTPGDSTGDGDAEGGADGDTAGGGEGADPGEQTDPLPGDSDEAPGGTGSAGDQNESEG